MKQNSNSPVSHALAAWCSLSVGNNGSEAEFGRMKCALNTSRPLLTHYAPDSSLTTTGSLAEFGQDNLVAVIGTPYWSSPELQECGDNVSHAHALASAYQQEGAGCLNRIRGAFSFIIIDKESEVLLAGIDRLGQYPLYYAMIDSGIVIASNAGSVLAHPKVAGEITNQGIYNYLYFHMVPSPTSIFGNLKKLSAAHYLEHSPTNTATKAYYLPNYKRNSSTSFEGFRDQFRMALKNSISRAAGKTEHVGTFLSGGLDSSTVTGMMSELRGGSVQAYSIGFDAEGYDEMAYARITASHFGVNLNEYYVTPDDVVNALPFIAASYDEPFGNSSALPAWFCAKFASENGVTRILAGDGGDELFAGNERYGAQRIFEAYKNVPRSLRAHLIEPLVRALPETFPLAVKAKNYIVQANTALPERLQYYNFLHQHAATQIFCPDFLSSVDINLPIQLQQDCYELPEHASTLDRMLYLDWQFTLADNDLRKVSHTAALAGIEVLYPLLDDELLEMSCRVPDALKLKGGNLRYFFKEALKGWLPQETIDKPKHGFGLPFGVWMSTHRPLQEIAYDTLLQLKERRYFKPEFIDSAIELHREGHASYYGELIWILVTFELWMRHK